jgi:hypothetical protein
MGFGHGHLLAYLEMGLLKNQISKMEKETRTGVQKKKKQYF